MLLQIQKSLNFLLIIFEWEWSKMGITTHPSYFRPASDKIHCCRNLIFGVFAGG